MPQQQTGLHVKKKKINPIPMKACIPNTNLSKEMITYKHLSGKECNSKWLDDKINDMTTQKCQYDLQLETRQWIGEEHGGIRQVFPYTR